MNNLEAADDQRQVLALGCAAFMGYSLSQTTGLIEIDEPSAAPLATRTLAFRLRPPVRRRRPPTRRLREVHGDDCLLADVANLRAQLQRELVEFRRAAELGTFRS